MAKPKRIQRRRTKGWKMPKGVVYVGRPTQWGNPFKVASGYPAISCVGDFRRYVIGRLSNGTGYPLAELRGKDLACWCPLDRPCHADVLLEIANSGVTDDTLAEQIAEKPWIPVMQSLPPSGKVVDTKIDDAMGVRNEQPLKRSGNLWFFPDGSMYVYYTPTHWRILEQEAGERKNG